MPFRLGVEWHQKRLLRKRPRQRLFAALAPYSDGFEGGYQLTRFEARGKSGMILLLSGGTRWR